MPVRQKIPKIPKKKLIIYIIFIVAMFSATGFLLYKNHKLTGGGKGQEINNFNSILEFNGGESAGGAAEEEEGAASGSAISGADIFNSPKFRALKNNLLKKANFIIGKEDPFEAREQE